MRTTLQSMTLVIALTVSGLALAAPTLDAQGKCRDNGKFVKAELCAGQHKPSNHCRDVTTKKFAKCGAPNTEPVPESAPAQH